MRCLSIPAVLVSLLALACAGPVQVLRTSDDVADRLDAIAELRDEAEAGRIEALTEALHDENPAVRAAAAEALGALGKPGRESLLAGLERAPGACEAAQVLAGQAVAYPEMAARLDPTEAWRGEDSCVTGAFLGLGAATHPIVLEALTAPDAARARHGRWVACRVEPPLLGVVETRLKEEGDGAELEMAALGSLLAEPPAACAEEVETLWRRLFAGRETRRLAAEVLDGHARRLELLRARLPEHAGCQGPDALLLLVEEGHEPSTDELNVLREALATAPEDTCPGIEPQPLIVHLLQRGVQAASRDESKARLALLARLGWRPTTDLAHVHAAVISGDYEAAAGYGRVAGPVLLDALIRYELSDEARDLVLGGLGALGRSYAPEVEARLVGAEEAARRDDLLFVLQRLLGSKSPRLVELVLSELETTRQGASGGVERMQHLAKLVRGAGKGARGPLAEAAKAEGRPQLRAMLLGLLIEVDGRRGKLVLETARAILDSGREDLAATSAAAHLVSTDRKRVSKRLKKAMKAGGLDTGEVQLLRILVGQDRVKASKLALKATKKLKDPDALGKLAEQLDSAGATWPAWICANKAFERRRKRLAKAKAEPDDASSEAIEKAFQLRSRLLLTLTRVSLDPIVAGKLRARALKAVAKSADQLPDGGREYSRQLAEALANESSRKLKRYMKKAIKAIRKAIARGGG